MTPLLIIYIIGFVIGWRLFAGHWAWSSARSYCQPKPDGFDWFMPGLLGGGATALFWPVIVLGAALFFIVPIIWKKIDGMLTKVNLPTNKFVIGAERNRESIKKNAESYRF